MIMLKRGYITLASIPQSVPFVPTLHVLYIKSRCHHSIVFCLVFLRSFIKRSYSGLISWKAGYQHIHCSVVSSFSPHSLQLGSVIIPILPRCLRSLGRSRLIRYLDESGLIDVKGHVVRCKVSPIDPHFDIILSYASWHRLRRSRTAKL